MNLTAAGLMLAVAGCQSGDGVAGLDLGGDKRAEDSGKIKMSQLAAYCPKVMLREGTAYFNTYAGKGEEDASKLIYQASITDVTRTCSVAGGMTTVDVAVAGKIVPGPLGKPGTITMPIRVAAIAGDQVVYSQLHKFPVTVGEDATQFVFHDSAVTFPTPSERNMAIFAGYDEGPPARTASR